MEWSTRRRVGQSKTKTKQGKLQILPFWVWVQRAERLCPSSLADCNTLLSLGLALLLHAALLGRLPTALAPPISQSLRCNPGFIFTASSNGLKGPPCKDSHLASAAKPWSGGKGHTCVSFMTQARTTQQMLPSWLPVWSSP